MPKKKTEELEETGNRSVDILRRVQKANAACADMLIMDPSEFERVPSMSTGILSLDLITGGYPYGRIIECFGAPSGGKTTTTLHAIASAQVAGGVCAFIDAEAALDIYLAAKLGVQVDELLVSQPDCGEDALNAVMTLAKNMGKGDLIVVDSVAALTPQAEIDGEIGDHHVGLQARMMSQALRKMASIVSKSQCIVYFINQIRKKIGMTWGSNENTSGGEALKFYASQRIDVRKIGTIKHGDDPIGAKTKYKIVKNKTFPPFREAETELIFGKGIYRAGDVLENAVKMGVVDKSGAWYSYKDTRLGQGKQQAAENLENSELLVEIEKKILELHGWK